MWKRLKQMNRRKILLLVAILIVGVLATGGFLYAHLYVAPSVGLDSGAYKHITNAAFGYTVTYAAEWGVDASDDKAHLELYVPITKDGPGRAGFTINCAANPSGMTDQLWWEYHSVPTDFEKPLGPVTLKSGTSAFKSNAKGGQNPYELYTTVHNGKACQLLNEVHGSAQITQQAEAAINSFTWNR
jgi:hypothetical protein